MEKNRLQISIDRTQKAINKTNERIGVFEVQAKALYQQLDKIQELFDKIRNIPSDKKIHFKKLKKVRLNWKKQAEEIEKDNKKIRGLMFAGPLLIGGEIFLIKAFHDQNQLENIFIMISERDIKSYDLAIVELNERIKRIVDESKKLEKAMTKIESFGSDYDKLTEPEQYELGSYVNLMNATTQLLINPIKGLVPKYTEKDFKVYESWRNKKTNQNICMKYKTLIISFANFLYKIELTDRDKKLIWRSFRNNKTILQSMNISKNEFVFDIVESACEALSYQQFCRTEI